MNDKPEKTELERVREWLDEVKAHIPETAERGEKLINSAFAEGLSEEEIEKMYPEGNIERLNTINQYKREAARWANNQLTKRKI